MNAPVEIGELRIDSEAQADFACLTGDYNPIHLDAAVGRRSSFGNVIVHGMNVALSAVERYLAACKREAAAPLPQLARLQLQFLKPVFIDERLSVVCSSSDRKRTRLAVRHEDADLARVTLVWAETEAGVEEGEPRSTALAPYQRVEPPRREPARRKIEDGEDVSGKLPLQIGGDRLAHAYPHGVEWLGERALASLALLSTIVGMEWPGEYSLLTNAKIDFRSGVDDNLPDHLTFKVISTESTFAFTRVAVEATAFAAEIEAFFRPMPVTQASMTELSRLVRADEFKGCTALVIGGSRGLGEITAKLLALGGAEIVLTYKSSSAEAEAVRKEIISAGVRCSSFQFDACARTAPAIPAVATSARLLLLYFPSPQIFRRRTSAFSKAWLAEFLKVYVDGFIDTLNMVKVQTSGPISILYPSSEALDQPGRELIEYAAAKAAGEAVCRAIIAEERRLSAEIPRLPRLLTDQTNSVAPVETARPAEILLPILRRMAGHRG
jgi:acyl dehydratase/NAD(P)-dependent dehydrogenase (short-subunit alcohol dehydrogenase family)